MDKDPVCGIEMDASEASVEVQYKKKTYYICSMSCKDEFVRDPKKYVGQTKKEIFDGSKREY